MQDICKFELKISVIPNELEKYMAFTINKNLIFIDSMQFMSSSLDILLKNLSDNDFKAFVLCFFGGFFFNFFQFFFFFFLPNYSPSKIIKNGFYYIKKYLLVLKILKFL